MLSWREIEKHFLEYADVEDSNDDSDTDDEDRKKHFVITLSSYITKSLNIHIFMPKILSHKKVYFYPY